ncbi:MAG: FG-GAP repeat domain-containing protein, partial [Marinicellaceae bacterium]
DERLKLTNVELGEFADFTKWTEINDAASFPDGQAQVTRGSGSLPYLFGKTTGPDDNRDAYCIKIDDPENFQITSDSNTQPFATADFDTRLFLFDKRGTPVLYNDDTPPSTAPYHSTLTGIATDGSNFGLSQAGEYVLVVAGFSDDPLDNVANQLFGSDSTFIHAANTDAGHFRAWENNSPATGNYVLSLKGVSPCQDKLDIVGTTFLEHSADFSLLCSGNGNGGTSICNASSSSSVKENVAVGYINQDSHLDAVFDYYAFDLPTVCLGDGKGGYSTCDTFDPGTDETINAVLGDINNDNMTDMVLISSVHSFQYSCLGLGDGTFEPCTTFINTNDDLSYEVQLAHMNGDRFLDVVISRLSSLEICLGDGLGGFGSCETTTVDAYSIHVADFDGDNILDVITNADGEMNHLCINDGDADLNCTSINADTNRTSGLAIGDLEGDGDVDVVFSNLIGDNPGINKVCLNSGIGTFSCNNISGFQGSFKSIKLGLMNHDNILDVVVSGDDLDFTESFTRICLGVGDGTFFQCNNDTKMPFNQIQLGEFGDFDVIFTNGFELFLD